MGPVSQEQGYGEMEGMVTEEHNLNVMVTTQANDPFVSGLDEPHGKNLPIALNSISHKPDGLTSKKWKTMSFIHETTSCLSPITQPLGVLLNKLAKKWKGNNTEESSHVRSSKRTHASGGYDVASMAQDSELSAVAMA
ncbi:hypothetical protein I3842_01G058400 [Carya illinoinensis]|uniref:Uncharacterized protein n=1 Tax=Carya illinoinensis TaxID=32201 RepID=A0A922K297_CARIL|nr:hypothetical protein I3842_01G058400 [Carya illinoinensis]